MEYMKRFKEMELLNHPDSTGDVRGRALCPSATIQEKKESTDKNFACAFNQYADEDEEQVAAVVGGTMITFYQIIKHVNNLKPLFAVAFPNDKKPRPDGRSESLYSVAWTYDTYEGENGGNPYKIVTGGSLGHLYVIDFAARKTVNKLRGFTGDINDIRTCPSNSNLIATVSSDQSIRIHHIRNEASLIVIGGLHSHSGSILSVDWHFNGDYILTCGFDHSIMKWDFTRDPAKGFLKTACEMLENGEMNAFRPKLDSDMDYDFSSQTIIPPKVNRGPGEEDEAVRDNRECLHYINEGCLNLYTPSAVCADLHTNYVDCVRCLPGTDLIITKGCDNDAVLHLISFGAPGPLKKFTSNSLEEREQSTMLLGTCRNPNGETWFCKFAVDPQRRWLVVPGGHGYVNFFDLQREKSMASFYVRIGTKTIRHADFSPCGRYMIATGDEAKVVRFDRIPDTVDPAKFQKFGYS